MKLFDVKHSALKVNHTIIFLCHYQIDIVFLEYLEIHSLNCTHCNNNVI